MVSSEIALVVTVHELSKEEEVSIVFLDVWAMSISVIKLEFIVSTLSLNRMRQLQLYLIMVEHLINEWSQHVTKNVITGPP